MDPSISASYPTMVLGHTHRRAQNACERCRKRKSRCLGTQPCEYCNKHNYDCVYTKRSRVEKRVDLPSSLTASNPQKESAQATAPNPQNSVAAILAICKNLESSMKSLHCRFDTLEARISQLEGGPNTNPSTVSSATSDPDSPVELPTERFEELVSSICSGSVYSPGFVAMVKEKTGRNFQLFKAFLGQHTRFLRQLGSTVREEFGGLREDTEILEKSPLEVKRYLEAFLKNQPRSFLTTDGEVFDLYCRFYDVHPTEVHKLVSGETPVRKYNAAPLDNSEIMLLSVCVCFGCHFISKKVQFLNRNKTPTTGDAINHTPLSIILETERRALRNVFHCFSKVQRQTDGKTLVVALLLLFLYLNCTAYAKFGYFVLSVAVKRCTELNYQKIPAVPFSGNPTSMVMNEEIWSKRLLWAKCFIFDKDMATYLDRNSHIAESDIWTEAEFVDFAKYYIEKFYYITNTKGPLLEKLAQIQTRDGKVLQQKALFQVFHEFAMSSCIGFIIMVYYTLYCICLLISQFSREDYLASVVNAITGIKEATDRTLREKCLQRLYDALDKINDFTKAFEKFKEALPPNCLFNERFDISCYPSQNMSTHDLFGAEAKDPLFGCYTAKQLETNTTELGLLMLVMQYKYMNYFIRAHSVAYKACSAVYEDDQLVGYLLRCLGVEFDALKQSFGQRARRFKLRGVQTSRRMQKFTLAVIPQHIRAVQVCASYIACSYYMIFQDILEGGDGDWVLEKVEDIRLMVQCLMKSLQQCLIPGDENGSLFKTVTAVCIGHLKDAYGVDFLQDAEIQEFGQILAQDEYLGKLAEKCEIFGKKSPFSGLNMAGLERTQWHGDSEDGFTFDSAVPLLEKTFFSINNDSVGAYDQVESLFGQSTFGGMIPTQTNIDLGTTTRDDLVLNLLALDPLE